MNQPLEICHLGRRPYDEVHDLQQRCLKARIEGRIGDTLLLVEHDPIVTMGRKSDPDAADGVAVPVLAVERGGEATYHGPGQLVAYPIMLLEEGERDLHKYLRSLEQVVMNVLASHGIQGRREEGKTGVWIADQKVASIGVAVRRWVTWHGIALNVNTDLGAFHTFRPCGLEPNVMTRMADHLEREVNLEQVAVDFVTRFVGQFGYFKVVELRS
ncbi:MAG: lipoyl(octanoyl) transferase LipB [Planctomycetota bacterium]|nr:lipoyl(octanoyl) transferase LipB [Planctomycetota bacterium]